MRTVLAPVRTTRFGQWLVRKYRSRTDPEHAEVLTTGSLQERFTFVYERHKWSAPESRSGRGSTIEATETLRPQLEALLRELDVQTVFDAGCGDYNWMRTVEFSGSYVGGDIVVPLIDSLQQEHGRPGREFVVFDLTQQVPPRSDLILCREVLFHLAFADIARALELMKSSGSTYLLTTVDLETRRNYDAESGGHRHLNPELPPLSFPPAERFLTDDRISDRRSLGLYRLSDIPTMPS